LYKATTPRLHNNDKKKKMSNSNNQFAEWRPKPEEADRNIYWALNPKVELRISPIQGGGLFATQKIYAGELIWDDVRCALLTPSLF
jgi:hypothetical protein